MSKHAHVITLFSSASTLVCCALPALFVSLGAGAALAGLTSAVPQLIFLSQHKLEVFGFATCMIALSAYMQYRSRHAPCPIDPELARACTKQRRFSRIIFIFSLVMYVTGLTFAFILPRIV